jgi:phosphate-selective porin OprO and OprP
MFRINKLVLKKLAVVSLLGCAATAHAAEKELLDILLGNGAITKPQYDELLAKKELTKSDVTVVSLGKGGGLKFTSADGATEVEIGGRLHLDYVDHSYNPKIGSAPVSGTQIRRGRVEFDGVFFDRFAWAAEIDFAKNVTAIKDFKIGYVSEGGTKVYVGHQKQPYSLSLEMSSNDEPFLERGVDNFLVAAFADRAIGLRAETNGSNWFVAGGVFGDTLKTGGPGNEGWSVSGRTVYAPVISEKGVVHLGVRGLYREIDTSTPILSIRDKTSDFSELSIVDTHAMADAENVTLMGPEFGAAFGPLFLVGEYTTATLDRKGSPSVDFDSWHVTATLALTGESYAKRYRMSDGEFKNIRPNKPFVLGTDAIGAWEIGARFATINLNDGSVLGGEEDVGSVNLNWYLNANVRMMLDWTRILDTDGSSAIRRFAPDMDIYTLRSQYNF